jgi:protein NrfD
MERIWKVYTHPNFTSFLALMVWGYTIFLILIAVTLYLAFTRPEGPAMKVVMWIGLTVAILVAGGVGLLLGGDAARMFWHVGLLPVQFPVFALASGVALMLITVGWFGPKSDSAQRASLLWTLSLLAISLSVVKLFFLVADFAQSLYGGSPDNVLAVQSLISGPYRLSFWVVQIAIGTVIPILVLSQPKLAKNDAIAGLMGLFLLIGYAVARILIVVPGQIAPMLPGLAEAFSGPKLSFDYSPSLMEWSVTSAVMGFAILAILIGMDYLLGYLGRLTEVKK